MVQYIVDAFAEQVFQGNPAAIIVLPEWPSEEMMMNITLENNLSETAFAVPEGEYYHLRWFTPTGEIDLCGHATLAAAYVLFRFYHPEAEKISFTTKSGILTVVRRGELLEMDFPAYTLKKLEVTEELVDAIGGVPVLELWRARDLVCVIENEEDVVNLKPDLAKVKALKGALLHVTAKGSKFDCVSRTFAPKMNLPEDPVCGSGHCHLIPYWAEVLGKNEMVAYQASRRGGVLYCKLDGERVVMAGKAALYSKSELYIDQK